MAKAFKKQYMEDNKRDQFTVEINRSFRKWLNAWKKILDHPSDSVVLKFLAVCGGNAMDGTFGKDLAKYMFKKDRARLSERPDILDKMR